MDLLVYFSIWLTTIIKPISKHKLADGLNQIQTYTHFESRDWPT